MSKLLNVSSSRHARSKATTQNIMLDVMNANAKVLQDPAPFARVSGGTNEGLLLISGDTITIADIEMNVLTEESESSVNELVTTIDRRIREINTRSRHCSKTEAALLCALDYCADKVKMQRKAKKLEAMVAQQSIEIEELNAEIAALKEKFNIPVKAITTGNE